MALPSWNTGSWTSSHIVRWCAAQQNWDKIHYDQEFARSAQGLGGPVINGALKQQLLMEYLGRTHPAGTWWPLTFGVRFLRPDLVGDELAVTGTVTGVSCHGPWERHEVELRVENTDRGHVSAEASAVVGVRVDGVAGEDVPPDLPGRSVPEEPDPGATVERFRSLIGVTTETLESTVPVSASRIRLFVDALSLDAAEYREAFETRSGEPLVPFLYPFHGVEAAPGARPLSHDPESFGREGSSEVGKNPAAVLGLSGARLLNGGTRVDVHGRARVGDRLRADSELVSVRERVGRESGSMLIVEALNRYRTSSGRLLLVERSTTILR